MTRVGALWCGTIGGLLAAGLACAQPRREPPEGEPPAQAGVRQDRRFSGFVRLQTRAGVDSVRVELINLDVPAATTLDRLELPFEGTLVVHVVAGDATVTVGGDRQERTQGQIWTVPPGVPLGLATGRDAASLQAVLVESR